jgi:PII-like signaling protein
MPDERQQIAESILSVLKECGRSLKAREIADSLHRHGLTLTRTMVNSVLHGELSQGGHVVQDAEYRWASQTKKSAKAFGQESSELGQDHNSRHSVNGDSTSTQDRRAARRVLQVLRSGTTSCRAAKAVSVGTERIEQDVYARTDSLFRDGTKGDMIVFAADWGFGKSHMRMLLSNHLTEQDIPFVHECVDARAASLSHIHRSIPRWLERIQFARCTGLRDAISNGVIPPDKALSWAMSNYSDFGFGLRYALGGHEWGWLRAFGHLYRSPDYPYQHPKAWSLFESVATFLNKMGRGGLVLLLDEAENIDRQYDIRGRRKSYETLGRMMRHPHILPVVFVTDRLLYQVEQDAQQGIAYGWSNWTTEAKSFVMQFRELQPIRLPRLTDGLAEKLVSSIKVLYRTAYPTCSELAPETVVKHWRQTSTRSTRLLVRLTINELDLLSQNGVVASR